MTTALKLVPTSVFGAALVLLSACGGGGSGDSGNSVTTYQVNATAGNGGTISPAAATVNAGGTTMLTVTANSGYTISGVTGCGGTLSGSAYTTGAITNSCTVTASFIAQYAVTATAGVGGTISPTSATVNAGATTTLTVTPKSGYVLNGVAGCGGSLTGTTYTTGTVNAACTVTASFAPAFTWVGGSNTAGASAVYGTQGVVAATNVPGARDGGITWTDASGNLWMFGGFAGYPNPLNLSLGNFLNDLWKYSPSSGQWTWVGGATTACSQGVYGAKGVAASTNVPGARVGTSWTDASGNMWLFGGGGCDSTGAFIMFDDLWEYSPSSGLWTWVGGSSNPNVSAVYGAKGVAAATNTPGSRFGSARWIDANGNVVMFGGYGFGGPPQDSDLNDLWQYSPSSGQWTWLGGPTTFNTKGVYGTQGVPDTANVPGARLGTVNWTDAQGNFWLFGGSGYDSNGTQQGVLNDLWKYSPSTGEWTWMGGSTIMNATGVYGTQGLAAAANVPSARASAVSWMDASGNVWLFGGEGYDTVNSPHLYHRLNDLWKYSPSSGQWTWVAGSNTFDATGVYGTQGAAAATNVPGARASESTWKDASGNVWMFGGYTYDDPSDTRFEMNDLWKFPAQ